MISESEDSSSEDEFFDNAICLIPQTRVFRNRSNPFDLYNEIEFKSRYRFSRDTVMLLLSHIENNLVSITDRNHPIDPMNQLLIALRFYATGAFQNVLGDHINISKATVSRIIIKVTHNIALLKPLFLKMPSEEEVKKTKQKFYFVAGFPGVIGAIDCTHIRIQSPGGQDAERFRNRKGYFSINVQAVCNSQLNFLNLVARWPGSVHDSTIFNDCPLKHEMEAGHFPNCYLLGDNGYPCKQYLLTPLLNPTTEQEQAYNRSHILTRNTIERAFGVLKRRFPCLSVGLRLQLKTTLAVIVACFVLHNIALEVKDEEPPADPNVQVPPDAFDAIPTGPAGPHFHTSARTSLINSVFT